MADEKKSVWSWIVEILRLIAAVIAGWGGSVLS